MRNNINLFIINIIISNKFYFFQFLSRVLNYIILFISYLYNILIYIYIRIILYIIILLLIILKK